MGFSRNLLHEMVNEPFFVLSNCICFFLSILTKHMQMFEALYCSVSLYCRYEFYFLQIASIKFYIVSGKSFGSSFV